MTLEDEVKEWRARIEKMDEEGKEIDDEYYGWLDKNHVVELDSDDADSLKFALGDLASDWCIVNGLYYYRKDVVREWVEAHKEDIEYLKEHFKRSGLKDQTHEEIVVDMLDDILDVWLDTHKNDPCETCQENKESMVKKVGP